MEYFYLKPLHSDDSVIFYLLLITLLFKNTTQHSYIQALLVLVVIAFAMKAICIFYGRL